MAAARSAASPRRAAPTKRPIWCRSWCAPCFGNNNVDTCARVCHSPTGYGLSKTFGTSAGTQDFDSVEEADVIVVIGANPTDAHPVFASRMKKRLRQGAKLIVIDPRRTDLVRIAAYRGALSSAAAARHQCRHAERAGACHRHRGAGRTRPSCASAATATPSPIGPRSSAGRRTARRRSRNSPAFRPRTSAPPRGFMPPAAMRAIYYGLGVTEHSQGTTDGHGDGQSRDGDRQYRPARRRRESAARPEQCPGRLRHGLVPARVARLSPYLRRRDARAVREAIGA